MDELEIKIRERIAEIKSDDRLTYKPATIQVNAPLALIQVGMMSALNELESLIGEPRSRLPLEKQQ